MRFDACPVKIIHADDTVAEITVMGGSGQYSLLPTQVVSTIPLTALVHLIEPAAPDEVLDAVNKLKFRSHVSLFLTINKPSVFPDQWLYFPDREIPFCRITEPKNFSRQMSPLEKTSLLVEFFCWEGDLLWNADEEELCSLCIPWLEKMGFVKRVEILDSYIHREKYAYPVYDLPYRGHLGTVTQYLDRFKNLQCLGRAGSFRYNNQDHALEMGILAARNIIEGRSYRIDEVGGTQEYLERGDARLSRN